MAPLAGLMGEPRRQPPPQRSQRGRPWLSLASLDVAWSRVRKAVARRLVEPSSRSGKLGAFDGCCGSLTGIALVSATLLLIFLALRRGIPASPAHFASLIDPETLAVGIERRGPYIDSADISEAQSWPSALDDLPPVRADERGAGGDSEAGVTGKGADAARVERGLQGEEQRGEAGAKAERDDESACERGGDGCPDIIVRAKGPLHLRMEAVCAGYAMAQLLSMKLSPPLPDGLAAPHPNSSSSSSGNPNTATANATTGAGAGSGGEGAGEAAAGAGEEGPRQLRLAVLWLPDSGVWDAHYHDLFLPLPLSPSLPDDHDPSHHASQSGASNTAAGEGTAGAGTSGGGTAAAAGGGVVMMLHDKPAWLRAPRYAEGRLDLDFMPAPSQPASRQQPQQPQQRPHQQQPLHNPNNTQHAPGLTQQQNPFPRPMRRRRLLSHKPSTSGQHSSRRLVSARVLVPTPETPENGQQGTSRRRLAAAAAGDGGKAGSSGSSTVTVNLHLLSSLRHIAASLDVTPNSEESTELQSSMLECYGLLQPAPAVRDMVERENLTHVRQSTAVYMEPVVSDCTGCDPKLLVNCTARRLMWLYLAQPASLTTLAAFWPSQALATAYTFHPARQPHLLRTTLHRSEHCRPNPQRGELEAPPIVPAPQTPKEMAEARHQQDMARNVTRTDAAAADVAASMAKRKERRKWLDEVVAEQREAEKRTVRGKDGSGAGGEGAAEAEGAAERSDALIPDGALAGNSSEVGALGVKELAAGWVEGEEEGARKQRVLEFVKRMYGENMGATQLAGSEVEQRRQVRAMLKDLLGKDWKGLLEAEEKGEKEGEGDKGGEKVEGRKIGLSIVGQRRRLLQLLQAEAGEGEEGKGARQGGEGAAAGEGGLGDEGSGNADGQRVEAGSMSEQGSRDEWERLNPKQKSIRCTQMEAAELFTLAHAGRLIHLKHSPQADFIQAQALARSVHEASEAAGAAAAGREEQSGAGWVEAMAEGVARGEAVGLVREEGICHAPSTKPINKHRIGHQLIVDEPLGLVYCWVPKVACTSWKVWIRQQHNDSHSNDLLSTHRPLASNLTELWYALSEPAAIRAITRPDLLRFVFVRQPFARIVSAYLNKHVAGGGPDGWGRRFWNRNFFGHLEYFRQMSNRTGGNFTFPQFVQLLENGMRFDRRKNMDNHLAPQSLLCGLDRIKYDFVGRFERMEEDVKYIMKRLGKEPGDAFDFGKSIHPTKSRDQMLQLYSDIATFYKVKNTYRADMDEPFNDIHYDPPPLSCKRNLNENEHSDKTYHVFAPSKEGG